MTTLLNRDNRLFILATKERRPSSALAAIGVVLVLLLVMIATQVAARLVLRPMFPGQVESVADPIAEIIGFMSIFAGLWVWLRLSTTRPLWTLGFGLFAAVYSLAEGGLWGVCAWHAVWNWTQGRLLGFPVSGGAVNRGLLVSARGTGPELITGGDFGPDGGLAATIVLLIAIGIVLKRSRR